LGNANANANRRKTMNTSADVFILLVILRYFVILFADEWLEQFGAGEECGCNQFLNSQPGGRPCFLIPINSSQVVSHHH
jgi:hypothetical protein